MGKKNKTNKKEKYPFVSVCTPTFNRRPFIPIMLKCFEHQTYPKDKIEWIIVDDGTDKIEDLIKHIPQIKYLKYEEKMTLGKKRNIANGECKGDIIVYMDDDDYYPPERISHCVEILKANPKALCAGTSTMYMYFKHIHKMYTFGPYGPNHATAATFAFRKKLLNITKFKESASIAEEKHFLKDYTIPMVQLDPTQVILVVAHPHNTFDKKTMVKQGKDTDMLVADWIEDPLLYQFFKYDIQCLPSKREEFSIRIGNSVMKEEEIIQTLNQQHQYILYLSKQIKELKDMKYPE
jgi:glycosyltransferase involved in cell wall biosynthesis